MLPTLQTAEAEPDADGRALAQLADWCGRYTPWTAVDGGGCEPGGGAGLLLDITGCAHLFGGEAALLADLVRRMARLGYAARAALADTPGAAWGLARFATTPGESCLVNPVGAARPALAPLPPAALRLTPDRLELLTRLGLTRVADLYAIPPAALAPRFGAQIAARLAQVLGQAGEPISPRLPVPPFLTRRVFAEPTLTAEAVAQGLSRLLAGLCERLELEHRGARRLELRLYRVDGSLRQLALGTSRPSRDPAHLERLFLGQLERIDPGFGIEVMTLAAPVTEPLSALQLALGIEAAAGEPPVAAAAGAGALAELLDRLLGRFGTENVIALAPLESHLPERAQHRVTPLSGEAEAAWPDPETRPPRPLRLLEPPEPVEATALLPDHPPAQFRWRRVRHRVARAEGPERLAPEWWRPDDADNALRAGARDYFRVEDEDGRRFWLYRTAGRWFLHGVFA